MQTNIVTTATTTITTMSIQKLEQMDDIVRHVRCEQYDVALEKINVIELGDTLAELIRNHLDAHSSANNNHFIDAFNKLMYSWSYQDLRLLDWNCYLRSLLREKQYTMAKYIITYLKECSDEDDSEDDDKDSEDDGDDGEDDDDDSKGEDGSEDDGEDDKLNEQVS